MTLSGNQDERCQCGRRLVVAGGGGVGRRCHHERAAWAAGQRVNIHSAIVSPVDLEYTPSATDRSSFYLWLHTHMHTHMHACTHKLDIIGSVRKMLIRLLQLVRKTSRNNDKLKEAR